MVSKFKTEKEFPFEWMNPPEEKIKDIQEVFQTDIVIIGAGQAGTCAARAISEVEGVSAIVVEQQEREHQFILGSGEVGTINSKWQEENGVKRIDIEEFLNDWQLRANNRANYKLIKKYAEKSGECFDWFIEVLTKEERGKIYPILKNPSEHMPGNLNGIHSYPGSAGMTVPIQNIAVKKNQNLAEKRGISFWFETKAERLVKKENRVAGVIVSRKGKGYIQINARKGVILAAGDYSANRQMCKDLLTERADLLENENWSGKGWDGSGILMGIWAGGKLEPRSHAAIGGNYELPGYEVTGSAALLRVNKYGKRFSNEGFANHVIAGIPATRQPEGFLYAVFDSNIREELTYQAPCHSVFDYCNEKRQKKLDEYLEGALAAGKEGYIVNATPDPPTRIFSADSIEELAEILFDTGKTRKTFIEEVKRYNTWAKNGKDEDFGKDAALLHEIKKAPFFAVRQIKDKYQAIEKGLKITVTVSGLLTDENQQVLDDDYETIPGLFATGNCSGGRFGLQYCAAMSGQSLSIAQTLGREAGYYVAKHC